MSDELKAPKGAVLVRGCDDNVLSSSFIPTGDLQVDASSVSQQRHLHSALRANRC